MITEKEADILVNRSYKVITEPTVEPITVEEVKIFARIDGNDEDELLENFIKTARKNIEKYLRRALIQQTIRLIADEWNGKVIELPYPPLISIDSVETIDEDDTATTYDSDYYYTITESIPGQLIIKKDVSMPSNTERYSGGYRITYKAGYGDSAGDVPTPIKTALMQWVAVIYETRAVTDEPPPEAKRLLRIFRVMRI